MSDQPLDPNAGVKIDKPPEQPPTPATQAAVDSVAQQRLAWRKSLQDMETLWRKRVFTFCQIFSVICGLILTGISAWEIDLTQVPKSHLMKEQVEFQHEALQSQKERIQAELRELQALQEENRILKDEAEVLRSQTKSLKASATNGRKGSWDNCLDLGAIDDRKTALLRTYIDNKE